MDTEPVYAYAETPVIQNIEFERDTKDKPVSLDKDYIRADVIELPPEGTVIQRNMDNKVLYTTHMESEEPQRHPRWKRALGIPRPPRTSLDNSRDIFDVDFKKIGRICLQAGLNIENYGIADIEAHILKDILHLCTFKTPIINTFSSDFCEFYSWEHTFLSYYKHLPICSYNILLV